MLSSVAPQATAPLSLAIVVVSCDRYADLWRPFFHLLDRYWPQRPGPVYLTTNFESPRFSGVQPIPVGPDVSWSDNLKNALGQIPHEYVLLLLEDLFLVGQVDEEELDGILRWTALERPNHVRLNPSERPYAPFNELVGRVPPGAPYRTSTVLTLWKKDVLAGVLKSGENAWQFEIAGSVRSDVFSEFYSAHRKYFPVINGVIRGKWQRSALRRLSQLNVCVETNTRPVMNGPESVRLFLIALRARAFKCVPWRLRRSIRQAFARRT